MNDTNTNLPELNTCPQLEQTSVPKKSKLPIILGSIFAALTLVLIIISIVCAVILDDRSEPSSRDPSEDISFASSDVDSTDFSHTESETELSDDESSGSEQEPVEWNLVLINRDNPVPENFAVELAEVEKGHTVDSRVAEPLKEMLAAARADGILPRITSSYRPAEQQLVELQEYIDRYLADGYTQEEAEAEARKWVAAPGYSEHETGLAVDISTSDWNAQAAPVVWEWLESNSWKYGFILRYTGHCNEITGASVEPWHFRYVGLEAAQYIYESNICLEEYLEQIKTVD